MRHLCGVGQKHDNPCIHDLKRAYLPVLMGLVNLYSHKIISLDLIRILCLVFRRMVQNLFLTLLTVVTLSNGYMEFYNLHDTILVLVKYVYLLVPLDLILVNKLALFSVLWRAWRTIAVLSFLKY